MQDLIQNLYTLTELMYAYHIQYDRPNNQWYIVNEEASIEEIAEKISMN